MRNLDELIKAVKEAVQEHSADAAALGTEYREAVAARDKAAADQQRAIVSGDQEAHAAACAAEKYQNDRAHILYGKKTAPHFTPQEHNALVAEINQAVRAENAPLLDHLWELIDEWNTTVAQLSHNQMRAYNMGNTLLSLIPFEHQNRSDAPNWNHVMGGMNIEDSFFVFGNESKAVPVVSILRQYRPKTSKKGG